MGVAAQGAFRRRRRALSATLRSNARARSSCDRALRRLRSAAARACRACAMLVSWSAKTERTLEAFRRPVIIVARTFVPPQPAWPENKTAGLGEGRRRNVGAR